MRTPVRNGQMDAGLSGAGKAGSWQEGSIQQRNIVHLPATRRSGPNPGAPAWPWRRASEPGLPVLGPRTADRVQPPTVSSQTFLTGDTVSSKAGHSWGPEPTSDMRKELTAHCEHTDQLWGWHKGRGGAAPPASTRGLALCPVTLLPSPCFYGR